MRLIRRAQAIRRSLGASAELRDLVDADFPPKPVGMHQQTYERLRTEYDRAHGDFVLSLGLAEAMETQARRRAELALFPEKVRTFAQVSRNVLDSGWHRGFFARILRSPE